ncbi:hypothetical protein [Marisediminicola senii]|uniref:hypothetical protein n=1 Tax=Marisediminicola senii TaxID=2711233 RepID=UPI0013EB452C|nr:hypothetical protein [Marisediminicola senii]
MSDDTTNRPSDSPPPLIPPPVRTTDTADLTGAVRGTDGTVGTNNPDGSPVFVQPGEPYATPSADERTSDMDAAAPRDDQPAGDYADEPVPAEQPTYEQPTTDFGDADTTSAESTYQQPLANFGDDNAPADESLPAELANDTNAESGRTEADSNVDTDANRDSEHANTFGDGPEALSDNADGTPPLPAEPARSELPMVDPPLVIPASDTRDDADARDDDSDTRDNADARDADSTVTADQPYNEDLDGVDDPAPDTRAFDEPGTEYRDDDTAAAGSAAAAASTIDYAGYQDDDNDADRDADRRSETVDLGTRRDEQPAEVPVTPSAEQQPYTPVVPASTAAPVAAAAAAMGPGNQNGGAAASTDPTADTARYEQQAEAAQAAPPRDQQADTQRYDTAAAPTRDQQADTQRYDTAAAPTRDQQADTQRYDTAAAPTRDQQVDTQRADTHNYGQPPVAPQSQQQRGFVAPPEQPKKKGNRGIGTLIAIVSVIGFALLYAIVAAIIISVGAPTQSLSDTLVRFFSDPVFYFPAILFVVGFVIVVLLANRAGWWAHVLGSLFVGAFVYFGSIGGALLLDNVVTMTMDEAVARFTDYAANPFVIAAGLVAREVALWTGSAIGARGRRIKARNVAAKEEYERKTAEHRAEYERSYAPAS